MGEGVKCLNKEIKKNYINKTFTYTHIYIERDIDRHIYMSINMCT